MNAFLRIIDRISGSFGILAAWIVLPLIIATVYEVLSRYLFNAPTIWAYEIGYMAMGANFLLGAAFTLREGAHIRIDLFYTRLRPRTRALIDVLGFLFLFLPIGFWLSSRLGEYALDAFQSGEHSGESAWNPVIWPFRTVFFIGFAVLTLQAVAECIRALQTLFGYKTTTEDSDNG
jgi:TRAP-type mannitol/chloroaromatic compound transport system permease small subunit